MFPLCTHAQLMRIATTLIEHDFTTKRVNEQGSILRGNSLAAKMCSRLARDASDAFIVRLFGPWVEQLAARSKDGQLLLAEQPQALCAAADQWVALVSGEGAVRDVPQTVRTLARCIARMCDAHLPADRKWPMVGGLIVLRLYCPALTSPNTHGLVAADHAMGADFRKNLVAVTRLVQAACNHQPFKEGAHMVVLNEWIERNMGAMDEFLRRVVEEGGGEGNGGDGDGDEEHHQPPPLDTTLMRRLVDTMLAPHGASIGVPNELLSKIASSKQRANPTSTSPSASAAKGAVLAALLDKQRSQKDAFERQLERYAWPSPWLKEYLGAQVLATEQLRRCVTVCQLLANDKFGVACVPRTGKQNHVVFTARDAADWLCVNLKLVQRAQAFVLLQAMVDASLVQAWKAELKDRVGSPQVEDTDRAFWFDYAMLAKYARAQELAEETAWKRSTLASYQLAQVGALVGVAGAPPMSERDQWLALLGISLAMLDGKWGLGRREGSSSSSSFTREALAQWCKSYMGFETDAQSAQLLESLVGDGFVVVGTESGSSSYSFNESKIRSWEQRKGGTLPSKSPKVAPRVISYPPPAPVVSVPTLSIPAGAAATAKRGNSSNRFDNLDDGDEDYNYGNDNNNNNSSSPKQGKSPSGGGFSKFVVSWMPKSPRK